MTLIPARWLVASATAILVLVVLVSGRDQPLRVWTDDPKQSVAFNSAESVRRRELDAQLRIILARVNRKNELAQRLINGTATLAEAVTTFVNLNRQDQLVWEMIRQHRPGLDEEERTACNVIGYVRSQNLAADHAVVMAQLRAEYYCLYGHEFE